MRRAFVAAGSLLLCGAIAARSRPAVAGKTGRIVFVFVRVDAVQSVAVLRPMIPPDIGVRLESGPRKLEPGTVLECEASAREHDAILEGEAGKVSEMLLQCLPAGEAGRARTFIVKTVDFHPHR
jgi:hypothetical protein